jgi:acylphosphatase
MTANRRVRIVAAGRVQGVGFRRFVERTATSLGVRGWVRNRPDGAVELVAEASDEALDALRAALRRGPPGARVLTLDEAPDPGADPLPATFVIARD